MKKWLPALSLCLLPFALFAQKTPDEALQALIDGNIRYTKDQLSHADVSSDRRDAIAAKQTPFAILVCCSDSRVPPEIIFDQGLGDVFIVRVAGNVAAPVEIESVEFAAAVLKASVVVVLGHESCGAVDAVFKNSASSIPAIAGLVEPAIRSTKSTKVDTLESAIKANAMNTAKTLMGSPVLKRLVDQKKLKIVSGYYDLRTGRVSILGS